MLERLVVAAVQLEERMRASPLHNAWATYSIGSDPTVATLFFRKRNHLEAAMRLEAAYAAGLISEETFDLKFPKVFCIAVNAHYDTDFSVLPERTFVTEGAKLIVPELGDTLAAVHIELCHGSGYQYIADDQRYRGDLILSILSSRQGTAWRVFRNDNSGVAKLLGVRRGDDVVEAFRKLEQYVRTEG